MPEPLLPTIDFCGHELTRLIIGGNPLRGGSHVSRELSQEMREYHTVDHAVETLLRAQECGLNAMQSRGDAIVFEFVRAYREAGGTMKWIVQTASEHPDLFQNIHDIAARDPIGIYWHGTRTDRMWKEGRIDEVLDYLKAIRDTGKLVGIASHMPEVLRYIEEQEWDIDFYMVCFYNLSRQDHESAIVSGKQREEVYDDADRELACEFIRATDKPCIAYKILAASRKCGSEDDVRKAFRWAFNHIKPGDIVDVGMWQKYRDQAGANARIVRELLCERAVA